MLFGYRRFVTRDSTLEGWGLRVQAQANENFQTSFSFMDE